MTQHGAGWKAAAIDDIPPVKPDWPATWKSMRHHFGITAFGVNAVTKEAGNVLIPEHAHPDTGEQELYVIQRGAARATLDGQEVDVPAGSAVAVEGPVRRKFEARSRRRPSSSSAARRGRPTRSAAGSASLAICGRGGTGKHAGFRGRCSRELGGSTPSARIG